MQNSNLWHPSKYVYKNARLRASLDPKEVKIASRFMADVIADLYERHIKLHARGKLLDLGCGNVPLFQAYKAFISENTCVDWGQSLHRNPFLDFEMDLNNRLLLEDESFDTIILSDVLEHIRKPEVLWCEMYRVLKLDGKLIMNVPFYYWVHEQPYDYFRYTEYALKSMAEDAGFKVIKLESYGGVPEVLTDIFSKVFARIPLVGKGVSILLQKVSRAFLNTKIGRKASKRTSSHFPFGYFLIAEKNARFTLDKIA